MVNEVEICSTYLSAITTGVNGYIGCAVIATSECVNSEKH